MTTVLKVEVRDHTRLVHRGIDLTTKASIKANTEVIQRSNTTRKAVATSVVHPILETKTTNGTQIAKLKPVVILMRSTRTP